MATSTRNRRGKAAPRVTRQPPGNFPRRSSKSAFRYAVFILWVAVLAISGTTGGLRSGGSVVFWMVASVAVVHLVASGLRLAPPVGLFPRIRAVLVLASVAAAVVVFDPVTLDTFNVTKLAVVVIGAAMLLALAAVEWVATSRPPDWRNGLHWPVAALLGWTALATLTSTDVRLSVLGVYGSYNGFVSTVALVVIFIAAARTFRMPDLQRVLSALWFSVGGLVILYGFFQLHDAVWGGKWDWVLWGEASFGQPIWSTLGNPNHLAGMLAVLLPLGVTMFAVMQGRIRRGLVVLMMLGLIIQLIYTEGRGGWLGAATALVVLGATWSPELRRHPRAVMGGVVALVAVVGLGVAVLGDDVDVVDRVSTAFDLDEGTTAQRIGQWEAAADMAVDRPLTGYGPETFRLYFNRRHSEDFADQFGANHTTAGSHNLFTDYAATVGIPGLIAFVWLLVAIGRRSVSSWRATRLREAVGVDVDGVDPHTTRLLLGGVVAGLVAFIVQSSFNLQQIALWSVFWLLLALLTIIARATKTPDGAVRAESTTSGRPPLIATIGVGAVAVAAFVAVAVLSTMPWRADRHYKEARVARNVGSAAVESEQAPFLLQRAASEFDRASDLNPWEPTYLNDAGQLRLFMVTRSDVLGRDPVSLAEEAAGLYRDAVDLRPEGFDVLDGYADALLALHSVTPGGRPDAVREAVGVLERALERNPHSQRIQERLADARQLLHSLED